MDRYAYTLNNPMNMVDPSGHNPECGPDGDLCDNDPNNDNDYPQMRKPNDDEWFEYLMKRASPDVSCLAYCQANTGIREKNYELYKLLLRALYEKFGFGMYVTRTGKLTDQALLAIIRLGEFGNNGYIGDDNNSVGIRAYEESMSALSNQYWTTHPGNHEIQCKGDCTLSEQLLWLQLIPSFRTHNADYYFDETGVIGYEAVKDMLTSPYGKSWMWGNFPSRPGYTITAGPVDTAQGPYIVYYP
jgi:hypothetical protein